MPTLRQLTAQHGALLVLDAASAHVQVGWWPETGDPRWFGADGEAGNLLFRGVEQLHADVASAGAFVYCDGPGSILGVRSAAVAIRTWSVLRPRPVYAYHSLAILAAAMADPSLTVIADARRESWHCISMEMPLTRVPTGELPDRVVMPAGFRSWTKLPRPVPTVPYSIETILPEIMDVDLFRPVVAPDAFLHQEPSYVKWTPQIHRAP